MQSSLEFQNHNLASSSLLACFRLNGMQGLKFLNTLEDCENLALGTVHDET